jgi:NTP pyrophosphatase (non-canonical NTP hydrolase)
MTTNLTTMDNHTTIQELKVLLREFRDKREWSQFHDPKNLAEAISIEAGELMELFLWKDKEEVIKKIKDDINFRTEVGEELADVINYCLQFANSTGLDISTIVKDKVNKTEKKYPVDKAKGSATKYTKL